MNPEALGQRKALVAVDEILRNLINPALGYQEMRRAGIKTDTTPEEDLDILLKSLLELSNNINAAVNRIDRGEKLPEITEGTEQIDLKYTNHVAAEETI